MRIHVDDRGAAQPLAIGPSCATQQAKLEASDAQSFREFGASVSSDADTAVIGAWADAGSDSYSGSAYVFARNGTSWTQQAELITDDGMTSDYFGAAVSIDGDTAVVGAFECDTNGSGSGAAYAFVRSGTVWTQQAKIVPGDNSAGDVFGCSVAIDGDTAVIGAFGDEVSGPGSGSAYIFVRSGTSWTQEAKLIGVGVAAYDSFGLSVSIDGDSALIGAAYADDAGTDSGSAYAFVRTGVSWTQQAKLLAGNAAAGDEFGVGVSIEGDAALIGARYSGLNDRGSVYFFERSGTRWTQQARLTANDAAPDDNFGNAVSLAGETAVIGAPDDDHDGGESSGSAYVFALGSGDGPAWVTFCYGDGSGTPCPCANPGDSCEGCANGTGSGAVLLAGGSNSGSAGDLGLGGRQLAPNQAGLYFQGLNAVNGGAGDVFGDGLRCVGGGVIRLQVRVADGAGSSDTTVSIAATGNVAPGDIRRYQLWYRDPAGTPCGSTFNLSPGVEIHWIP